MSAPARRLLAGWGGRPASAAEVLSPATTDEAAAIVARAAGEGTRVLARGLGRSYGDAASSAGGRVLDLTGLDEVLGFDDSSGLCRAEAGLSIEGLLRFSVPRGFFVPVTPGTRQVTLGGAIAADVHGKNHHVDGSIGSWVRSIRLASSAGERLLAPAAEGEGFWATVGGMGLTGVVLDATVELVPIETSSMLVDTERGADLEECMSLMTERDEQYRYSVAWIDCLKGGAGLGRGVLTRANHASLADLQAAAPRRVEDPLRFSPRELARVPFTPPFRLPSRPVVTAFNELWFRKAPRRRMGELQSLGTYFHPLDGVGSWNRLYGPAGFTQYQFVVPFGAEVVVRQVLEALSARGLPSLLAVLKRFGAADPAPLSFPAPGWTLALDLPLSSPGLGALLDGFDELVASHGGRVYFAKDGRLRPELVSEMYPRLHEWRRACDELDPAGLFQSDLSRRLHLRKA